MSSTVGILSGILSQIHSKNIEHILNVMRKYQSSAIANFEILIDELSQEMKYAGDNTKFLKLLLEPFADINTSEYPKDIPVKLPKIIYLIRVMSLNCEYYKDKNMTERLFIFLSNAIINFCQTQVDISKILNAEPRYGIKICDMSIDCCTIYKQIYQRLVKRLQGEDFQEIWEQLETNKIFNKVDTFVHRLNDLMEICESIIVFSRKDETIKIPSMIFGGHKGSEMTTICSGLEKSFGEGLDKIKAASAEILDANSKEWYPKMSEFKNLIVSLDGIVKSLFAQVFANLNNVEEALDSLTVLYSFSKRKTLQSLYEEMVEKMWTMLETEVLNVSKDTTGSKEQLACLPLYAGKSVVLRIKMMRCQRLKDLLVNAQYLPALASTESKLQTYDVTMESIKKIVESYNNEWCKTIDSKPENYLTRFLITRSLSQNGLLECNIHRDILKNLNEAKHFELLNTPLPELILSINSKAQIVNSVYNKVVNVALLYNRILESLSSQERLLFRQHIKTMDKKVQPGIVRLNYGDAMTDEYITDCLKHLAEIQYFVDIYKIINSENVKLLERIANGRILNLNIDSVLTLKEFKKQFKDSRDASTFEIGSIYKQIIKHIFLIYEGFERHLTNEIGQRWMDYIRRIDAMSEFAIVNCARSTALGLVNLLKNNRINPNTFIAIKIVLRDRQIFFEPSMESLTNVLTKVYSDIVKSVKIFPRLNDKLNLPPTRTIRDFYQVVAEDYEFVSYMNQINELIGANSRATSVYIDTWMNFRSLWETDIDHFMSNYQVNGLELTDFERHMINYFDLESELMIQDETVSVTYVKFDCSDLKKTVLAYIESWKRSLKETLYTTAVKKLENFNNTLTSHLDFLQEKSSSAELDAKLHLHQQSVDELQERQEDISSIKEYFNVLSKRHFHNKIKFLINISQKNTEYMLNQRLGRSLR